MSKKNLRKLSWGEIVELCKTSFLEFIKENSFMHGAALAYYTIFAMVPIIYLAIVTFGKVVGADTMVEIISSLLRSYVGIEDVSGITSFLAELDLGQGSLVLKVVGIFVLIFSSTAIFNSLKNSINEFYDIQPSKKRNAIVNTLISRGVSFALLSMFGLLVVLVYFGQTLFISIADSFIAESGGWRWFWLNVAEHGSVILTNCVLFAFIFKYLHDGKIRWKLAWGGAFFTSILLYLGQLLIKYYLVNYFFAKDGGVAGTLLVILSWMYYSSQIIFLGAKFIAVYARMVGKPIFAK